MFKVEDIKAYKTGRNLSKEVWKVANQWSFLARKTVGEQVIRSTDSISANIAEGFGRVHKMDKVKFYYNARASVYESIHWIKLAFERNLISKDWEEHVLKEMGELPKEINILIKLTISNLKK